MSSGAAAEMPKYKCHKEVWALKIEDIVPHNYDKPNEETNGNLMLIVEKPFAPIEVTREWVTKHGAKGGGYYVVYKDGYKSYSPEEAFIDGYSRI
jgi:hypothetical protein